MKCLISTSTKHSSVPHIACTEDGSTFALCQRGKHGVRYPYLGAKVTGGEWVLADVDDSAAICSRCRAAANPKPKPEKPQRKTREEKEREKLEAWNNLWGGARYK